jgi:DNA polymerase I-like protein with 3'-5' exonuclease and polymerase domains
MSRNQCTNFPVQSASFHLLLYTLIEVQKMIKRLKLKTKLIGQVHDSILANVPISEIKVYHQEVHKITKNLQNKFKWLIVPIEIEVEISKTREEGGSMAEMQEVNPDDVKLWH